MVPCGLEPQTSRLLAERSSQLSYETRWYADALLAYNLLSGPPLQNQDQWPSVLRSGARGRPQNRPNKRTVFWADKRASHGLVHQAREPYFARA